MWLQCRVKISNAAITHNSARGPARDCPKRLCFYCCPSKWCNFCFSLREFVEIVKLHSCWFREVQKRSGFMLGRCEIYFTLMSSHFNTAISLMGKVHLFSLVWKVESQQCFCPLSIMWPLMRLKCLLFTQMLLLYTLKTYLLA